MLNKKQDACVPKFLQKRYPVYTVTVYTLDSSVSRIQDWKHVQQLAAGDLFLGLKFWTLKEVQTSDQEKPQAPDHFKLSLQIYILLNGLL